jgi:hypothetical protein
MKTAFLVGITFGCAFSAWAQGTVIFNNRIAGTIVTHVYVGGFSPFRGHTAADTPSGNDFPTNELTLASGNGWWTSLLGAQGANQSESFLAVGVLAAPVAGSSGTATTFRTGPAAGFIAGSTATFNNIAPDAPVGTFEMVVWDNSSGLYPTWTTASLAWQSGLILAATSGTFDVDAIGGVLNPAPTLNALPSFNIYSTPEPSAVTLCGLGALAVLTLRRRW